MNRQWYGKTTNEKRLKEKQQYRNTPNTKNRPLRKHQKSIVGNVGVF